MFFFVFLTLTNFNENFSKYICGSADSKRYKQLVYLLNIFCYQQSKLDINKSAVTTVGFTT